MFHLLITFGGFVLELFLKFLFYNELERCYVHKLMQQLSIMFRYIYLSYKMEFFMLTPKSDSSTKDIPKVFRLIFLGALHSENSRKATSTFRVRTRGSSLGNLPCAVCSNHGSEIQISEAVHLCSSFHKRIHAFNMCTLIQSLHPHGSY